jgi:membrane-bound lytic murein transglycosylase B
VRYPTYGAIVLTALTAGCAGANPPLVTSTPPLARGATAAMEPSPLPRSAEIRPQAASFAAWRGTFRDRALSHGIAPETFEAAFRGVAPNAEVVRLDGRQAEFVRPIWDYLDSAVSAERIATGRREAQARAATLAAIEDRFGVDRAAVLAIWGMETNYGTFRGDIPVIQALATLAYQGRRRDWAEGELVAALRILQSGDASPSEMRGSWAGAMGHTQFVPTSFLAHAVDFTGDGRRNVWGSDPTDALASAANYLRAYGWQKGRPWGVEVRLPDGFNYAEADQDNRRDVGHWRARGVTTATGQPLPDHGPAALLAPAGARGPVFAVYNNFFVIKRYNNATSYAVGVGHLGDRIAGGGAFAGAWPRSERALSRTESIELQERLTARGYDTGGTDGIIGPNTIAAIRAFQSTQGMTPDGFATAALLQQLR